MRRLTKLGSSRWQPFGVALALGILLLPVVLSPQVLLALPPIDGYQAIRDLMDGKRRQQRAAAEMLMASGNPHWIPPLVDALFFTPVIERRRLVEVLEGLAGETVGRDYYDWVELVGRRQELVAPPGYVAWKVELFSRIDPRYGQILYPGMPQRIRLEEVVWGGVPLDGIPPLEAPPHVAAQQARGLTDDELVFAIALGGESRAWPLRYVSWHEMVNDTVGGRPLTVSY